MRIAERSEHTAEVCGDILHNKGKRHIFFLARGGQYEIPQGQKGKQRHIVCNQHRPDKGDVRQRKHARARVFEQPYDLFCKHEKEIDILKQIYEIPSDKYVEMMTQYFTYQ